jgi:hypothetical protein
VLLVPDGFEILRSRRRSKHPKKRKEKEKKTEKTKFNDISLLGCGN